MGGGFRGGMGGGFRGGSFAGSGFRGGYDGFRGGYGASHGGNYGFHGRNRFFFGYGYYPGNYWPYYGAGWGYGYPYYSYPYAGYSYPSAYYDYGSSASSPVVIYQSEPPVAVYDVPERAQSHEYWENFSTQGSEKIVYLIALKGQDNICAAQAYWFTGNTLHFVTLEGAARQTPINSIDRALTFRLNRDRHVDFRLPAQQ